MGIMHYTVIINSALIILLLWDKASNSKLDTTRIRIDDLYRGMELLENYLNIELDDGTKHYPKFIKRK